MEVTHKAQLYFFCSNYVHHLVIGALLLQCGDEMVLYVKSANLYPARMGYWHHLDRYLCANDHCGDYGLEQLYSRSAVLLHPSALCIECIL